MLSMGSAGAGRLGHYKEPQVPCCLHSQPHVSRHKNTWVLPVVCQCQVDRGPGKQLGLPGDQETFQGSDKDP